MPPAAILMSPTESSGRRAPRSNPLRLETAGYHASRGQRSVPIPDRTRRDAGQRFSSDISADYFATGDFRSFERVWSDSEVPDAHVAVVNQTMARELWPDDSRLDASSDARVH